MVIRIRKSNMWEWKILVQIIRRAVGAKLSKSARREEGKASLKVLFQIRWQLFRERRKNLRLWGVALIKTNFAKEFFWKMTMKSTRNAHKYVEALERLQWKNIINHAWSNQGCRRRTALLKCQAMQLCLCCVLVLPGSQPSLHPAENAALQQHRTQLAGTWSSPPVVPASCWLQQLISYISIKNTKLK